MPNLYLCHRLLLFGAVQHCVDRVSLSVWHAWMFPDRKTVDTSGGLQDCGNGLAGPGAALVVAGRCAPPSAGPPAVGLCPSGAMASQRSSCCRTLELSSPLRNSVTSSRLVYALPIIWLHRELARSQMYRPINDKSSWPIAQGDSVLVCYLRDVRSALELRSLATGARGAAGCGRQPLAAVRLSGGAQPSDVCQQPSAVLAAKHGTCSLHSLQF